MIQLVEEYGFCFGVQVAVDKANNYIGNNTKPIYLYGDLANNQKLIETYKQQGFIVVNTINEIEPDSIVIIRAHGIPKKIYENLQAKNVTIEDCTCPKVRNIHKIVEQRSEMGYRIIIIGKNGHPEVDGIYGWCKKDTGFVAETEEDLNDYFENNKHNLSPICVVAQTTCNKSWLDMAIKIIATKPNVEICDTLCNVNSKRILNATQVAKNSTAMIVVGDEKSANSKELFNSCKNVCQNTFFVTDLNHLLTTDFEKYLLNKNSKIGIAGSASAPAEIIDEIYNHLIFYDFLNTAKNEIEVSTDSYLQQKIEEVSMKPFIAESIARFYSQNQGGKRIRGAMIKLGAMIASNTEENLDTKTYENYLRLATAYEIFQTAILIHDDIIDKSTTRRGKTTIHIELSNLKQNSGMSASSANHFGISQGICIGDYGLFLANQILANLNIEGSIFAEIFKLFSQIQLSTLEGEIMDVTLPCEPINIATDYSRYTNIVNHIFEYKTAWYTLVGPIILGSICAGNKKIGELLKEITLPLGIAFQIKDDLLGIYGNEETIGKDILSDIKEKKQTLIYGYAYKNATEEQRNKLDKSYGNPSATTEDLQTVREIFDLTGAKTFGENEITRLSEQSLSLINKSDFTNRHKAMLKGLVHYQLTRRK